MLKNGFHLEWKKNDKSTRLLTEPDISFEDIKEALFQFQKHVGQLEDNYKVQQEEAKKKAEEEKLKEEPKAE